MSTEYACPGRCNARFRAAEQNGPDHDEPFTPGQPIWCPGCRDQISADLADLWPLALNLAPGKLNTPRQVSTGETQHQRRSASPSGSPAWDAADALIRWAINLEDRTRARLAHAPAPSGRRMLDTTLRYLQAWTTAILSDTTGLDEGRTPDGERAGQQITHHRRTLTAVTGTDRLTHRIKGQCPRCDARGRLARADGTEVVKCGACGAMWSWDYFQHLARSITDNERPCAS